MLRRIPCWAVLFSGLGCVATAGAQSNPQGARVPVTPVASPATPADATPPAADTAAPAEATAGDVPGGDAEASEAAVASAPVDAGDAMGERYHQAFRELAAGDAERARASLQELITLARDHPLAARARGVLQTLDRAAAPSPLDQASESTEGTQPAAAAASGDHGPATTPWARAELLFVQTVHGVALGAELCVLAECDGARPWVLALMLGAGSGFGASFYASQDGITPALTRALTDGVLIGAMEGATLMVATGAAEDSDRGEKVAMAHLMGGQLVGLGVGALLYDELRPRTGQVSLTFSGGIWASVSAALMVGALDLSPDDRQWGTLLLVSGNAGLLAGAWLASEEPMGTSRVLVMDAGGLLGMLTGMGLSVLVQSDAQAQPTLGAGLAGALVGLGATYALTDGWDRDDGEADLRLDLMPVPGGAMVGVGGAF